MDTARFDALARGLAAPASRRAAGRFLAGIGLTGLLGHPVVAARKNRRKKATKDKNKTRRCANCCRADGASCRKKNAACRHGFCPRFAITASWDSDRNHDSYLFVPNDAGVSLPSPFFDQTCTICEPDTYPFACVNQDAEGPGDEVTTILSLLPGRYEYWLQLARGAPAGDVVVTLRDRGAVVLTSTSPANPQGEAGVSSWHVFNLDGRDDDLDEIDEVIADNLPRAAHVPNTFVCAP